MLEHPDRVTDVTLGRVDVIAQLLALLQVIMLVNLEDTHVVLVVDAAERLTILSELAVGTLAEGDAQG